MDIVTPVPDFTFEQNKGFLGSDTTPLIHSLRWRHLGTRYIFSDVDDVVTYHEDGPLTINEILHSVSYLDVYFLKEANIRKMEVYLRFVRQEDGILVEEPYAVGEGGREIKLVDDPSNDSLLVARGISFTQKDLGDGTPMYDFQRMAGFGEYEVWVKVVTADDREIHLRVPFQWEDTAPPPITEEPPEPQPEPDQPPTPKPVTGNLDVRYDEYRVSIVEGDSAFTKRPSTHFRQAAIGILQTPHCETVIETPPSVGETKPSPSPIIGNEPAPPCGLKIVTSVVYKSVGETAAFNLKHTNTSGILRVDKKFDKDNLLDLGDTSLKVLTRGLHEVTFIVTYQDGQECTVTGSIYGEFECDFGVTVANSPTTLDKEIQFKLSHGANAEDLVGVEMVMPSNITKTGDYKISSMNAGAYRITFIADYGDGNKCEKSVNVEFTDIPVTPPVTEPPVTEPPVVKPPITEPEPDNGGGSGGGDNGSGGGEKDPVPNVPSLPVMCGEIAQGDTGYSKMEHKVTESGIYYIEYNFLSQPDVMHVYAGGKEIYNTGERLYQAGSPFGFRYKPSDGKLIVKMNDNADGTRWAYTLYCPSSVPYEVSSKAKIVN